MRPEETVVSSVDGRKRSPEETANTSASFCLVYFHFNILSVKWSFLFVYPMPRLITVVYRGIWCGVETKTSQVVV